MRHRKKINHLGRKSAHRQETLSSLAAALILHKRINTTLAKAKALRVYVEPLITKSKVDSTHSRRVVFGYLGNKEAVSELFREISQKVAERPGGYTRILKTGFRKGDGAEMCFIELVDYNANMLQASEDSQQKRTRRSRRGKKASEESKEAGTTAVKKKEKAAVKAGPEAVGQEDPAAGEPVAEPPVAEEITGSEKGQEEPVAAEDVNKEEAGEKAANTDGDDAGEEKSGPQEEEKK
jgi:large subunit ribosomal protein L17